MYEPIYILDLRDIPTSGKMYSRLTCRLWGSGYEWAKGEEEIKKLRSNWLKKLISPLLA